MYFCKEEATCLNTTDVLSALLFSDYFNLKGTIIYAELFIKIFTDIQHSNFSLKFTILVKINSEQWDKIFICDGLILIAY